MTRVKICGITNVQDALAAVEYGASALGFVFVPGTQRCILDEPDIESMLRSIPPFVSRVGVCMSASQIPAGILPHIDVIQCYHPNPQSGDIGIRRWLPSFRIRSEADIAAIGPVLETYGATSYLLDAYHETSLGGAGVTFDWSLATNALQRYGGSLVLAGGLNPDNVSGAIGQVRPFAVDVSTAVESAETPRRKDHGKMRAFIEAAGRRG